ncbi:hypothetical protein EV144_101435 [Flavobacterium sp. 270]|uniref:carboxypeptidase regulatory-like domain-containing protein n=1 Tax=Flavobacterium sp. 270 TaxID=2512114 RepID=UPI001065E731|nr:carboxypeptidase regulatory-like domain-containing protein [Flavobacterium sp. 270]TDW51758.1 hypothetical protein EV144_101435 [Flavobacterium sp. 270]
MKKILLSLIVLLIFIIIGCSNKKYTIYNAVTGRVVSSKDKKPIEDAKIYVKKYSSNNFDTIKTLKDGTFFIDGLELPYKYLHYQLNLSYDYCIEKSGYTKKIITIKNLKEANNNNNNNKLDTIDLGNIYLDE